MGRKRFKDQILCKILHMCRGGGKNKTQIIYSCNLNFHMVVSYLDLLIKNGLAETLEGEIVRYRITPKGIEALRHLQELEKLMQENEEEELWRKRVLHSRQVSCIIITI